MPRVGASGKLRCMTCDVDFKMARFNLRLRALASDGVLRRVVVVHVACLQTYIMPPLPMQDTDSAPKRDRNVI